MAMGWPAGDGSPEPQPDDFRLPKGPARKKKKGKKKKGSNRGQSWFNREKGRGDEDREHVVRLREEAEEMERRVAALQAKEMRLQLKYDAETRAFEEKEVAELMLAYVEVNKKIQDLKKETANFKATWIVNILSVVSLLQDTRFHIFRLLFTTEEVGNARLRHLFDLMLAAQKECKVLLEKNRAYLETQARKSRNYDSGLFHVMFVLGRSITTSRSSRQRRSCSKTSTDSRLLKLVTFVCARPHACKWICRHAVKVIWPWPVLGRRSPRRALRRLGRREEQGGRRAQVLGKNQCSASCDRPSTDASTKSAGRGSKQNKRQGSGSEDILSTQAHEVLSCPVGG